MKARVKATGEIVEVTRIIDKYIITNHPRTILFDKEELDFLKDDTPDYWDKLLHQYAGMAMQGMLSNAIGFDEVRRQADKNGISDLIPLIAGAAMDYATALVNKLKGVNN